VLKGKGPRREEKKPTKKGMELEIGETKKREDVTGFF